MAMNRSEESEIDPRDFAEILEAERVLDALGRGERIDADTTLSLLSEARAAADQNIPAAPDMSLVALELEARADTRLQLRALDEARTGDDAPANALARRNVIVRRGAVAVAAGGASFSGLLVAGGIAAAFAFGGLGYVTFSSADRSPEVTVAKQADSSAVSDATPSNPRQENNSEPPTVAPREEKPAEKPVEEAEPPAVVASEEKEPEPAPPTDTELNEGEPAGAESGEKEMPPATDVESGTVAPAPNEATLVRGEVPPANPPTAKTPTGSSSSSKQSTTTQAPTKPSQPATKPEPSDTPPVSPEPPSGYVRLTEKQKSEY